jgi:hypothetical protein
MNRGLPPAVLLPARANLFRGSMLDRSACAAATENRSPAQGRRFAFRAVRQADCAAGQRSDREQDGGQALLVMDERPDSTGSLNDADMRSSAPFLAGVIAQARPSPALHDPPYREAAGAYRRSDDLGVKSLRLGFRSDTRV